MNGVLPNMSVMKYLHVFLTFFETIILDSEILKFVHLVLSFGTLILSDTEMRTDTVKMCTEPITIIESVLVRTPHNSVQCIFY